jgi:glycosyltransferase involved in cell wall biosynthesis
MLYPDPVLDGSLSLVIPAHNEAANIGHVIEGCVNTLPRLAVDWEIVLVDDGSADDTAGVAGRAMKAYGPRLRIIGHPRKLGYGITVKDGLLTARGDYVAFMDGDGQFEIEDLVTLASHLDQADLVTGWRRRRADPAYRLVIAGVFNALVRLLYRVRFRDIDCGLKLMRRSVLDAAAPLLARSALLNTELYYKSRRNGFLIVQVPVTHHPRVAGVRSGARLIPILRAIRDLIWLRVRLAREWRPRVHVEPVPGSS